MKHLMKSIGLAVLLIAGIFFLLDSCKSAGKTSSMSSMKSSGSFADTAKMLQDTSGGKGNSTPKDKPPKPLK